MPPGYFRSKVWRSRSFESGKYNKPCWVTIVFSIFIFFVVFAGGSSRPDTQLLLLLRPASILCVMVILLLRQPNWHIIRPLPFLLAAFAASIAIQLVPLPPALWYRLPGRESYDAVALALGGTHAWHPLAIAPDMAWNSLVSLIVPLGCLVGFASLDGDQRRLLLWPMLGLIAFSMMLGVAQIAGGESSSLYWYKVSGRGQLIGLLANRNHQGAFLALALPLLRAWSLSETTKKKVALTHNIVFLAGAAIIILYILVLGSRAGLALTMVGIAAAWLVQPAIGLRSLPARQRWLVIAGLVIGVAAVLALALTTDRAVSIGRIADDDLRTEGRVAALPTLLHIITQTMPFGAGFGSFVPVYNSYEPDALLSPFYFNNAHNDLIELAITGGVPALLVFAGFLFWWARASWRSLASTDLGPWRPLQRASAFSILILLLASLTDYPLRTPLLGAVFTILCCWLAHPPKPDTPRQ